MSDLTEPPVFQAAVETVRSATVRSELVLTEIPAPSGLAPSAIAFAADVRPSSHGVDSVLGTGRFILLHDPEEPESWGGPFRIELAGHGDGAQIEIRASWTPRGDDFGAHLEAWGDLLCLLAGLPPSADVVGLLPRHRMARD